LKRKYLILEKRYYPARYLNNTVLAGLSAATLSLSLKYIDSLSSMLSLC